ncbi:MAG: DNA-directed RNA polymerase subunit beta [Clostridia bacterium]|jgi:DNA-directed RNA polymerase subunit beta
MAKSTLAIKKVKYANQERYDFSKVTEKLEVPYLLEMQKKAYQYFLEKGIAEMMGEISPIADFSGKAELYLLEHSFDTQSKYTEDECIYRGVTYAAPLKVRARLVIKETGEVIDQDVFLGDIPLMTEKGSFIINGNERVIVSQIMRSPGVYYSKDIDKAGKLIYKGTVMPYRGEWLEPEITATEQMRIYVARDTRTTIGVLLKALGFGTDSEIAELFGNNAIIKGTLDKEIQKTKEEALLELSRKLRPSDIPSADATESYLRSLFFTNRYDLTRVGRYKFNKKLSIANRIKEKIVAEDIKLGGKVFVKAGQVISREVAKDIQNAGINQVFLLLENGVKHKVIGNNQVELEKFININPKDLNLMDTVYYPVLAEILKNNKTKEKRIEALKQNVEFLCERRLTLDDIIASISYELDLSAGFGNTDNIDHLGNRRIRSVGELMANEFRKGLLQLSLRAKEILQVQDLTQVTPSVLINARHVNKVIRDFVRSSQLSQFMDQVNPLAELESKRKMSAVGPGALTKERASAEARDIHYTHYGRICTIQTPEGQSIGLITNLALYARMNEYGFLETPYVRVDKTNQKVTNDIVYLAADDEDEFYIAQATEPLNEDGTFVNARIMGRHREEIAEYPATYIDFIDVSPRQFISEAAGLVPFLENDDTPRALMASNMQRQAVPLLRTEEPIIATGLEAKVAHDSGALTLATQDGIVTYVDASKIIVKSNSSETKEYNLTKFKKSNQETCMTSKPIAKKGQKVKKGDILADGYSTKNGELALGRNMLIAFMSWEGYNYEDAILVSERISKEDVYTSINISMYETEARTTKLGDEEITRDIPNLGDDVLKNLDENGIVRIGAEVKSGDIIVGKVTPKGETELTPEERLLRAIFGEKAREVRDTSLRMPHGEGGVVIDVQIFSRQNKDDNLEPGVNQVVKVIVAKKRKLSVGDKMCGRHGNKGVVSRIMKESDMPFLADGTPVDIVLNPLGVPSRMNIGQALEVHLGLVAKAQGWHIATPAFDGARESDIQKLFIENNLPDNGKLEIFDGRTGEAFENTVTVGYMYMFKLIHMVDSKIHARSTGPYSLVTKQPLGGKAQFGGQRFGEMEVWALEAYGAANILQEILTVKSDDEAGRQKTYEAIVQGLPIPEPGIPEAFRVLVKEMQGLGLDIKILNEAKQEISIDDVSNDDVFKSGLEQEPEKEEISLNIEDNPIKNDTIASEPLEDFDESMLFEDMDE